MRAAFAMRAFTAFTTATTAPAFAAAIAGFARYGLGRCFGNDCRYSRLSFDRFLAARRTRRAILTSALAVAAFAAVGIARAFIRTLGPILAFGPLATGFAIAARLIAIA